MTHPAFRNAQQIQADWSHLAPTLPRLVEALKDAQDPQHGVDYSGVHVSGGSTVVDDDGFPMPPFTDPTGEAVANPGKEATRAKHDERNLIALTRNVIAQLEQLQRIADLYLRPTMDADTAKDLTDESNEEAHCESCWRIQDKQTKERHWSPIYVTSDVNGNLTEPMALCRWCWTWVRHNCGLPPRAKLEQHQRGQKVFRHDVA